MPEFTDRAKALSTVLVAARHLEAIFESREAYPGVILDSEFESWLFLLQLEMRGGLGDPIFDMELLQINPDLDWDDRKTRETLKLIAATAPLGLGVEFDVGIEGAPETYAQRIWPKAIEACSPAVLYGLPRIQHILAFDCQNPTLEFDDEVDRVAFAIRRFEALWDSYRELLHTRDAGMWPVSDPIAPFWSQFRLRLNAAAAFLDDIELVQSVADLTEAVTLEDIEVVWEEVIPSKARRVEEAFQAIRWNVPSRPRRLTKAEDLFLQEAQRRIRDYQRKLDAKRAAILARPASEEHSGPSITAEVLRDCERLGLVCRVPIRIEPVGNQGAAHVMANDLEIRVPRSSVKVLLRLVLGLEESREGWVLLEDPIDVQLAGSTDSGSIRSLFDRNVNAYKEMTRLRPIFGSLAAQLAVEQTDLFQSVSGRARFSAHRDLITLDFQGFELHIDENVRRLVRDVGTARTARIAPVSRSEPE